MLAKKKIIKTESSNIGSSRWLCRKTQMAFTNTVGKIKMVELIHVVKHCGDHSSRLVAIHSFSSYSEVPYVR